MKFPKSLWKLLAMALASAALFAACSAPVGAQFSDERALSDAQRIYKSAALVVMGECLQSHINSDGATCYDLRVDEVVAGDAQVGDVIHCTRGSMKDGETYLLYLAFGEDTYQTEDMHRYELLSEAPLLVSNDGTVAFSGSELALSDIKQDIRKMDSVVTAPSNTFYYKDLEPLVDAADDIFIGRVNEVPALSEMSLRTQADGTTIENTRPVSIARIEAYGSLKGALNYGDEIEMIYSPAMSDDLVDASTLKALSYDASVAPALEEGKTYLFFLIKSPDAKQDYYFTINPMQGYVEIDKSDTVSVSTVNRALAGEKDLNALVQAIREAVDF